MFGSIGGPELLLIFVLALLLFGPRKLPEIGRTVGKTLAEFRRATNEFRTSLEREVELEKIREVKSELKDPFQISPGTAASGPAPVPFGRAVAGESNREPTTTEIATPAEGQGNTGVTGASGAEDAESGGDGRRSG